MKKIWEYAAHWHLLHRGESVCHMGYLAALYLGFEHLHVMLAGACVGFIFVGGVVEVALKMMEGE